mgnify:CR=1 FL=1
MDILEVPENTEKLSETAANLSGALGTSLICQQSFRFYPQGYSELIHNWAPHFFNVSKYFQNESCCSSICSSDIGSLKRYTKSVNVFLCNT